MKTDLFTLKIRAILEQNGGRMSISEFRRQMGLRFHVRKDEMPQFLKELRRKRGFKVSKSKVRLLL